MALEDLGRQSWTFSILLHSKGDMTQSWHIWFSSGKSCALEERMYTAMCGGAGLEQHRPPLHSMGSREERSYIVHSATKHPRTWRSACRKSQSFTEPSRDAEAARAAESGQEQQGHRNGPRQEPTCPKSFHEEETSLSSVCSMHCIRDAGCQAHERASHHPSSTLAIAFLQSSALYACRVSS